MKSLLRLSKRFDIPGDVKELRKYIRVEQATGYTLAELLSDLRHTPQVRALAAVEERSRWHGGEGERTAKDHTDRVLLATGAYVTGDVAAFPHDTSTQQRLMHFLITPLATPEEVIQTYGDIQHALAVVHDIGKGPMEVAGILTYGVFVVDEQTNETSARGHEQRSAEMMPGVFQFLSSRGVVISRKNQELLTELARHHGDAYPLAIDDMPEVTRALPLEQRMEQTFVERGVMSPYRRVAILVNVIADLEAGRVDPGPYVGQAFGFSEKNKADARQLLGYYLKQLPQIT